MCNVDSNISVRIVTECEGNKDGYKLLSHFTIKNFHLIIPFFDYMIQNEVPLEINSQDIVDTDGEQYSVKDVRFIAPKISGETLPYIQVFVEE